MSTAGVNMRDRRTNLSEAQIQTLWQPQSDETVLWQGKPNAMVSTDCGAVRNMRGPPANAPSDEKAVAWTINNGTDLEMGTNIWTDSLVSAVGKGLVDEATVDEALRRQLLVTFEAGRFDPPESNSWTKIGTDVINSPAHQQIMHEAALQSLVLLKNENGTLPLEPGTHVAVVEPLSG